MASSKTAATSSELVVSETEDIAEQSGMIILSQVYMVEHSSDWIEGLREYFMNDRINDDVIYIFITKCARGVARNLFLGV